MRTSGSYSGIRSENQVRRRGLSGVGRPELEAVVSVGEGSQHSAPPGVSMASGFSQAGPSLSGACPSLPTGFHPSRELVGRKAGGEQGL